MHAHALRHILLKALALGVIAVMLTGVCAAQNSKKAKLSVQEELDNLPYYLFVDNVDSLKTLANSYERLLKKLKKQRSYNDRDELTLARIYLKLGDYKNARAKALKFLKENDEYMSFIACYIMADSYLAQKDFLKALHHVKVADSLQRCFFTFRCGQQADSWEVGQSLYFACCYSGLGDTSAALYWIFKNIFLDGALKILGKDSLGNEKFENESKTLFNLFITLVSNKYDKKALKQEFEKSLERMVKLDTTQLTFLEINVPMPYYFYFGERKVKTPAALAENIKHTQFYHWLQQ